MDTPISMANKANVNVSVLVEPMLDYVWINSFREGLAAVCKNGKYGHIDKTGNIVVPLEFSCVQDFHENRALVKKNDRCGFVDSTGQLTTELTYKYADSYFEKLARVLFEDVVP